MIGPFATIDTRHDGKVLFAELSAPPMNLLGPELVRDLVALLKAAEGDSAVQVIVFTSADPDFFISHVDVTRIPELRDAAVGLTDEPSLAVLFHHMASSRLITIAQIEGRVRGVGSEFALSCDMRFAAKERAIFGQFEVAFGVIPGAGAAQHLARLMGRARALEVLLSADDYDADLAERYGWINRALPAIELGDFVAGLAQRVAAVPATGRQTIKDRVNAIELPPVDEVREDSRLFLHGLGHPEAQPLIPAALKLGFQVRDAELALPDLLAKIVP